MTIKFITAVQAAKLIRKQLKANFPNTKFSVTTKNSININWTDGPTNSKVQNIVSAFSGTSFNGMIDLAYNTTSWMLPNGSVQVANSGNDGISDYGKSEKPHPDAIEVSFGASYIFTNRSQSLEALTMVTKDVVKHYCLEMPEINTYDDNTAYISSIDLIIENLGQRLSQLVHKQLNQTDLTDLTTYQPLFREIALQEFDIELEEEEEETKVNPLVETAKMLLKSMNPGDVLNTLIGGGQSLQEAINTMRGATSF